MPEALLALGTFQGPGVMGGLLAGELRSGRTPPSLSAASRSFPLLSSSLLGAILSLLVSLKGALFPFSSSGTALFVALVVWDFSSSRLLFSPGDRGLCFVSFLLMARRSFPSPTCSARSRACAPARRPSDPGALASALGRSCLPSVLCCFFGLEERPLPLLAWPWPGPALPGQLLVSPFLGLAERSLGLLLGSFLRGLGISSKCSSA